MHKNFCPKNRLPAAVFRMFHYSITNHYFWRYSDTLLDTQGGTIFLRTLRNSARWELGNETIFLKGAAMQALPGLLEWAFLWPHVPVLSVAKKAAFDPCDQNRGYIIYKLLYQTVTDLFAISNKKKFTRNYQIYKG